MKRRAFLAVVPVILLLAAWGGLLFHVRVREVLDRKQAAPAEGRFVPAGDGELFVQELGPRDGEMVLFTHGMGAWSGLWRLVLEPVCVKVRCVAVDLPPFGYSQRPGDLTYDRAAQARRLWALADSLGARKISIVGHSFGGGPAAEAALQHPERVSKLVLISPALGLGQPYAKPGALAALLAWPPLGRFVVAVTFTNPLLIRRGLGSFMADPASATEEMQRVLRRPIYIKGTNSALADWLPRFLYGEEKGLSKDPAAYPRLTMPALLIWGDRDATTPLPQGRALQLLIPGSRLEILPGIGHMPQLEAPGKVQALLVEHLAR